MQFIGVRYYTFLMLSTTMYIRCQAVFYTEPHSIQSPHGLHNSPHRLHIDSTQTPYSPHTFHLDSTQTPLRVQLDCTWTCYGLQIKSTLTMWTLYTPHTLYIHSTHTPHTFHIHSTYIPHTFHIHSTSLHIQSTSLHIHSTYIPHIFHIHSTYTPKRLSGVQIKSIKSMWTPHKVHKANVKFN